MNVLEGGIVSGTKRSIAFSCKNCTFVQNERADRKMKNTVRNVTTETQTYKNAEWNECSAPCGGALYVHDNSSATLTVENSSFAKCNATSTRGGGIFALNIAEFTVEHSTFVECFCLSSNDKGGASAEIEGMKIQVIVNNLGMMQQVQTEEGCHSHYRGGAISVRYYAYGTDKSGWFPNKGGRSRFVASKESQKNAKDTFSCGLNESCACLTISHCLSQMIVGFVEEIKVLSGTVEEGKGVNIGEKTITVNGVSPAGSSIETHFEGNGLSLFCVGTGKLAVSDLSVVHNTSFENNRQCRLFEVEGSGLTDVKRMSISMDAAHSEERSIQNSLVKLEGGELKMQDVRRGQTFSTASVISLSQESSVSLSLDNCAFSNIVRTAAGSSPMSVSEGSYSITFEGCTVDGCGSEASEFGGGIMVEVGSGNSLKMNGGVVRNCYASTTQVRGGGIGLKVKDTNAEFLISSSFEGNRAKWGSDIFVDSFNLESTATSGKITSLTASLETKSKMQGYENWDESFPIPLCVYLWNNFSEPEFVGGGSLSHDFSKCGFEEFPCLSISKAVSLHLEGKKKDVTILDPFVFEEELSLTENEWNIESKENEMKCEVSDQKEGTQNGLIESRFQCL
ncbi:uncharacterized protein MONOS_7296 [Monocercomonoides exilis]|uniref:uncharacterized protein n=1 Tax=Monocercomonoides exilis TaxID=2049356 RepID=UPI003559AE8F|nr:hypothetical protein MONOS_7296 [Monocercomonoides exilis]|eukprot:MONOS_7296.1-p1 / transcript=MONOS_7296.1 / gene=MONOS_7296 / organism=Monocercomonoides_exilis_PA203 / gene_product=unspecified product / transcript_product=unspecified product / location=Mono_scaffold00246:72738-74915(+) / protein_length=622 / sequence_SO=supercontig / SO=protein_coding / is_pseudo=false